VKYLLLMPMLCVAALAQYVRCDSTVVDDAQVLNIPHVETAAQSLNSAGADVRVWTFNSLYGGNLDHMKASRQGSCPSWQSADGGMKNNLIVMMVAVKDHKVGFYYGDQWGPALDSKWNTLVVSQQMKPRFRDVDFTGGFVAGLGEVERLIHSQDELATAPAVIVQQQAAAPTDYAGVGHVVALILGAGILCLLIVALCFFVDRRRKGKIAMARARQAALISQQEIIALIGKLTTALAAYDIVTTDKERVSRVRQLIDGASSSYSSLKQSSMANPNQDGLTTGQYESIAASYAGILSSLKDAEYLMEHPSHPITPGFRTSSRTQYAAQSAQKYDQSAVNSVSNGYQGANATNVFAPTIVENDPEPYRSPYRAPDPEPSSSGSSSSWGSSDSGSGGSSDWGSSSSDSGSSSDLGSSDFGGGGGGSSDF
jgi:uncharacterized membrane protein YgcG